MILIGHNGAGKSTFINYLLGFYTDSRQHPFLKNFSQHIKPIVNKKVGYAPEAAMLDLQMSASEYFSLMSVLKSFYNYDITDALRRVELDVDIHMPLKKYSKGMKQRFLLALALMGEPDIIILDEPTSGLDPYGQESIESLLLGLKNNFDFIICTHSMKLAFELDDEVWILKEGQIVVKQKFNSLSSLQDTMDKYQPEHLQ